MGTSLLGRPQAQDDLDIPTGRFDLRQGEQLAVALKAVALHATTRIRLVSPYQCCAFFRPSTQRRIEWRKK